MQQVNNLYYLHRTHGKACNAKGSDDIKMASCVESDDG